MAKKTFTHQQLESAVVEFLNHETVKGDVTFTSGICITLQKSYILYSL